MLKMEATLTESDLSGRSLIIITVCCILGVCSSASTNPAYSLVAKWHLSMGRFMVDTKASEKQIFNWSTLQSPTQAVSLLLKYFGFFFFFNLLQRLIFCLLGLAAGLSVCTCATGPPFLQPSA